MAGKRASVFDEVDLDLSDFTPTPAREGARKDQVRAIAEPASFRSREATEVSARREPRRHRTGRNVQLNLKVTQQDADAFYALADEHGWVLGEAFHMAIAALKQKDSG